MVNPAISLTPTATAHLLRTTGCEAPAYYRTLEPFYYCMKCDRPVMDHPRNENGTSWRWVDRDVVDRYTEVLGIMET